ncbi:MAG: GNAT family N-acetyltransferase [Chitinophagaceae bacterium]|nr:GNAT family N-acetyltransferase [Oligoflexus sp.]
MPDIAKGTSSDHKAVYALELRCFDPGMAFHERQIKDLLRNPRADVWLMRINNQIVAQLIVLRRRFRDGIHARIYSLTVDLAFRGQGLSRQLLTHALAELKKKKIRNVYLEVESDAHVPIQLYTSMGFSQHHVLTDYYEVGRHGIKMRKTLD